MKKSRFLCLILPAVALILEALPYGAVLNFMLYGGKIVRSTYSYFSLTPFGYANFGPMLTAVLTCGVALLAVLYCIYGTKRLYCMERELSLIAAAASLSPLIMGLDHFSFVGGLITLTLVGQWFCMLFIGKKDRKK